MNKEECMREVISDLTKPELVQLFDAVRSGDRCHVGILFTKMTHEAVDDWLNQPEPTQPIDRESTPLDESRRQDAKAGNYQLRRMYRK